MAVLGSLQGAPLRFPLQCKRYLHLHIRAPDPHLDAGHADVGIFPPLTGMDVESPSVPGAYDQVTIQTTFAQRSAGVRTGVVDGQKRAVDIAERKENAVDFNGAASPGRDLIHLGDSDVVGVRVHGIPSQITGWSDLSQDDVTF